MNTFNWFDNLKAKHKKDYNRHSYSNEFMRFLISMFDYDGLPETLEKRFLELYLHSCGSVLVGKIKDDLYCVPPNLSGDIDAYNQGTHACGICPIGRIDGTRGIDVVWGLNNNLAYPSTSIYRNAEIMSELDTSILTVTKFARISKVGVAKDNKTKTSLDETFKRIQNGEISTILSDNLLNELDSGKKSLEVLDFTDVKESDKLQYLFHAKDDVLRQFYNHYGQSSQGTSKMAQQTINEIEGGVSFIDPMDMLEQREKMCSEINRIFSTNISVKFARAWADEYAKYASMKEQNITDDVEKGVEEDEPIEEI